MLKRIWQSCVRWFRKLIGQGAGRSKLAGADRLTPEQLPPLDDTDREYLFMQLLEGVANGWQQPRAISFFNKVRQRVRKSEWLEWLDRFGNNLIQAPVPNYELADRMVKLSELDCGEVGDLAGEYGVKLLNRQASEFAQQLMPIVENEFAQQLMPIVEFETTDSDTEPFPEIPAELLIDRDPTTAPPSQSSITTDTKNPQTETREITLEEFLAMLQKDPDLVAELAEQFGVQTTDPREIVNIVIAQMQQQVHPVSGDLSAATEPADPALAANSPATRPTPPPPPAPKLAGKQEDPAEAVNTPDRGV